MLVGIFRPKNRDVNFVNVFDLDFGKWDKAKDTGREKRREEGEMLCDRKVVNDCLFSVSHSQKIILRNFWSIFMAV